MFEEISANETDPVSARRRETRSRLLDAATDVFTELGFQGASIERICARAEFTRGAFYSNFSTKEELFIALLEREYEARAHLIRARAAALTTYLTDTEVELSPQSVASIVTEFLAPLGQEASWFTLETEFLLMTLRDPAGPVQYSDFKSQFRDELNAVVEGIVHAAGRRFTIDPNRALTILASVYERAIRASALGGLEAPEGLAGLGESFAELLFAITECA
ncbi:TetR/AcrR family transcriptional regulator [Leucobacter sp. G161]|uniref:TetR/AcrR family transcriptional regulator n=1 Tax=Leucobacter sp. G161 TaxID=663704 RepID=UPI00073B8EED|nr:TetR/AcrR family transcriptional regulator [Leucobacter sp. G161]KUF05575.1 hypothetical protein AUL38_16280 [Leucobacter sp. G161]